MKEIALHLLDLVENAAKAKATQITIRLWEQREALLVSVTDNGVGRSAKGVKELLNPFFTTHPTKPVGLGIPLFAQSAQSTGGEMWVFSSKGWGTSVCGLFYTNHIDCRPLGDLETTLALVFHLYPHLCLAFVHTTKNGHYEIFQTEKALWEFPVLQQHIAHQRAYLYSNG